MSDYFATIDAIRTTPWAREVPVGSSTFGELLDEQIRFRVVGEGPLGNRTVVPDSEQAQQLVTTTEGKRALSRLNGMLGAFANRPEPTALKGIVLNRTMDQTAAQVAIGELAEFNRDTKYHIPVEISDNSAEHDRNELAAVAKMGSTIAPGIGANAGDIINIGASVSDLLMNFPEGGTGSTDDAMKGTIITQVLLHEAEHVQSLDPINSFMKPAYRRLTLQEAAQKTLPELLESLQPVAWLEEAGAQTLTLWGDRAARTATAMSMPYSDADDTKIVYAEQAESLERLLKLAGIDRESNDAYARGVEVLQSESLRFVPGNIAQGIIEHQGLNPRVYETLRRKIRDAGDEHHTKPRELLQRVAKIEDWVAAKQPRPEGTTS